jgi:excisionase family DNA binding protein
MHMDNAVMSEILTTEQAAEYLHLGRATVVSQARQGRIPATKIAGRWRFSRRQLRRWIEEEAAEDQALVRAAEEAYFDPDNQERIPLEQIRAELGL